MNSRKLMTASSGSTRVDFTYDVSGLRETKTVNNVAHTYSYAGGRLLRETYGNHVLDFAYDTNGAPYTLTIGETKYYYITNVQGDVMCLVDANGETVVQYTYDPWGKLLSTSGRMADTLGEINPIRYRGYYYDTETGFYYLQSRYYDPAICRFINADCYASGGHSFVGCNAFAYCRNDPVGYVDSAGFDAIWINEGNGAMWFGHAGFLVQDEEGSWWYFFWGQAGTALGESHIPNEYTDPNGNYDVACVEIGRIDGDMHDPEVVREALLNAGGSPAARAKSAKNTLSFVYFEGDYSKTQSAANDLAQNKPKEKYNLLFNNCVQKSASLMSLSNSNFSLVLFTPSALPIPNQVLVNVCLLPKEIGASPDALITQLIWQNAHSYLMH